MTTNRPLRVFLCHASNDKTAVRELYQKLNQLGIDAWLDEKKLLPGQNWEVEIPKAVKKADVVIVCLSKKSITKKGYVQKEILFALDVAQEQPENTIYVIPAKIQECKLPDRLRRFHAVNLFDTHGMDSLLESLKLRARSLKLKFESVQFSNSKTVVKEKIGDEKILNKRHKQYAKSLEEMYNKGKITLSNGMEFMRVIPGSFIMGSDNGRDDEKPRDFVHIPYDYWMARFTVTNEQYNEYCRAKKIKHPVSNWKKKKSHPVTYVKWTDAMEYCKWLNDLMKKELKHDLILLRLPTEAEWERAARATAGQTYPWGDEFDKDKCNSNESGKGGTTPVGSYSPQGDSFFGCADMAGNVWEWTHSIYKSYPYNVVDGREDEKDVTRMRVLRGGSYNNVDWDLRCAWRLMYLPDVQYDLIGFRIVLAPPIPK